MFRGVSTLSLDPKGRMAMPTRYRERLHDHCEGQLVITIDTDERCLLVYPLPEWEQIERKLDGLPALNRHALRLKRLLLGHAAEVELDTQGRLLVPPALRDYAGLDKKIVLIGQGKKFELWDEPHWTERRAQWLNEQTVGSDELPEELQSLSL